MKRQRRTLGLLLVGLSIALVAIGRRDQPTSQSVLQSLSTSARGAKSANAADGDALKRPVSLGSLAWLVGDPRCSLGAQQVLRINAEEDGLSRRREAVALQFATRRQAISWQWSAWAAYAAWDFSSSSAHALAPASAARLDGGPIRCGARLGWSGCTIYRSGIDWQEGTSAASQRRLHLPHRFARAVARLARRSTSLLSPWPSQLAGQCEASTSESIRISRLPNLAAPKSAKPQTVNGGDSSSACDQVL